MILVVGATGQSGTEIIGKLLNAGKTVRALVRPKSNYDHLKDLGNDLEFAFGYLRDKFSLEEACKGVETVIATANNVLPSKKYGKSSFESVEGQGYTNLFEACQGQGVRNFVLASVPLSKFDKLVPTVRYKRRIEQQLQASGMKYTIFRISVFMDVWFALIGSSIVLRGSAASSMKRPFWLATILMKGIGGAVEKRGLAFVPGMGKTRHAFITIDDAALIIANSVDYPEAMDTIFELGGPEILSWDEVALKFGKALGRPVKPVHTLPLVYRAGISIFNPFSETAANLMGLNLMSSLTETAYDNEGLEPFITRPLTTVEEFISLKKTLPVQTSPDPRAGAA